MRIRFIAALVLALPLLVQCTGCIYSREIAATQRAIERENPGVDFDKRFVFSMGRGSIGTVAELASFARVSEARMASHYLDNLSKVKVGVYELDGDYDAALDLSTIPHFRRGGWQTLARVRQLEGENVAVLYRERYGEVRDLFVVSLSKPDLVIVRLTGNFTEMLIDALADFSDRIPRIGLFDAPKVVEKSLE